MVAAADVQQRLEAELSAAQVRVHDLAGCGTSFEVYIVSASFAGKRVRERHEMVYAALAPLMPHIHALSIRKVKTPEEEEAAATKQQQQQQPAAA